MSDRIDEFFKTKLTDHAMAPTPRAWSKVEANLSKKNKGIIWFRAAAALLFLGLLVVTIVWLQSKRIETTSPTITNAIVFGEKETLLKKSNAEGELKYDLKKKPRTTTPRQSYLTHVDKSIEIKNQVLQKIEQSGEEDNIIEVAEPIAVSQPKVKKPIVLEFRLEEVSTPMPLTKLNEQEVAEVDSKSGIQKAIGFALEVKNGESPVMNLRQAKENLFALNFKKDKKTITKQ